MADYAFYKNVIEQKYTHNDKEKQLHEIFSDIMNKNSTTIDKIMPIFQMFKYYERLSYAAGDKREELFNIENQQEFLVGLGSNVGFVKSLIKHIDDGLVQILDCPEEQKAAKIKSIKDVIRMGTQFNERDMFILYYMKSLENRLFKVVADLELEKDAISLFKVNKEDNRNIQRMFDMVKDIDDCRHHKKFVERLEVKVKKSTQEKYAEVGLDPSTFDKSKVTVFPLRHGVWDLTLTDDVGNYKVPLELQPYLDIFNAYYTMRHPHMNVSYDFNKGRAIVSVILSGTEYKIEVTTPQLFMLKQFNAMELISARDLAKNLGMTLKQLTPVLNSLIKSGLVDREKGEKDNPDLKFFLNKKFKRPQTEFSIISFMPSNAPQVDDEIEDKFAHKRVDILKCLMVNILKNSDKLTAQQLIQECMKKLSIFKVTTVLFKSALTTAIKEEYVIQQSDDDGTKYYKFYLKEDSDDEDDDDISEDEEISDDEADEAYDADDVDDADDKMMEEVD